MGFHGVFAKNLVDHLMERYGKIWVSAIEAYIQDLVDTIEVDRLIDVNFQCVGDAIQFAKDRKTPFTPAQNFN